MAVVREPMETTLIPNTRMNKMIVNGVHNGYEIQAINGYVLHDGRNDEPIFDPEILEETGDVIPHFKTDATTVPVSYDFDNVTNGVYTYTDESGAKINVPVEKVGMYEFSTVNNELADNLNELYDGVN